MFLRKFEDSGKMVGLTIEIYIIYPIKIEKAGKVIYNRQKNHFYVIT